MEHAALGDDACDVACRSDIKSRVADADSVRSQLSAAVVGDFDGGSFFDGNGVSGGSGGIDGGPGSSDIKGNAVFAGEHGDAVGSDLVGDVAVGGDAIGADNDGMYFALAHEAGGHVVAEDGGGDPIGHQFPGGEARALKERACFVGEDMNPFAALDGGANDSKCGPVAAGGERSGVAMGEHSSLLGHQVCAKGAHGATGGDVFVVHGASFGFESGADGGHRCVLLLQLSKDAFHAVDGPEEIDGCGACAGQQIAACAEGNGELGRSGSGGGFGGERQAHGCADADGWCTAHDHGGDDVGDILVGGGEDVGFFKWQSGLIEEPDAVLGPFKGGNHLFLSLSGRTGVEERGRGKGFHFFLDVNATNSIELGSRLAEIAVQAD